MAKRDTEETFDIPVDLQPLEDEAAFMLRVQREVRLRYPYVDDATDRQRVAELAQEMRAKPETRGG